MSSDEEGKLPPGQTRIARILRWGTDHPGITRTTPNIDLKTWTLAVDGEVKKPLRLGWADFEKLPMVKSVSDFHCVEGWSVIGCEWEGVRFSHITGLTKPKKEAKHVLFECADGYTTSLALEDLLGNDAILAMKLNGKMLEVGYGFPVRLIVPGRYAYKSALWLTRILFMKNRELGYWEKRGFSDSADVWKHDRYGK